ncbi:uncharacterized protein LOC135244925 [Anguilla rostrata]|uniref:uncharacterized protein LOC135244925 n=1 Tax=Anguilla rostrata TaxID=7938 RepID=UPI0030CC1B6A
MSEGKRKRRSQYARSWRSAKKCLRTTRANAHRDDTQSSSNGIAEHREEINIPEPRNSHEEMTRTGVPYSDVEIPHLDEDAVTGSQVDTDLDHPKDSSLCEELRAWANEFSIKPNALDALLKILQQHGHQELPSTSHTLMQTSRDVFAQWVFKNFLLPTMLHKKPSSINFRREVRSPQLGIPASPNPSSFADEFSTFCATAQMESRAQDQTTEFQRVVLQQLATITETQIEITQMLRRLKRNEPGAVRVSVLDALDPAKSEDELQVLEDQLQDKEHQRKMTQYLSTMGGKDLADGVRRVMLAIATHTVWSNYSVHGKKGKKPLKNMTVYSVILRAVMASRPNDTLADVAVQVQETLKHAPARCKKVSAEAPGPPSISPSDGEL